MHAINGYIFGNLSGYNVKQGEKVRWHLVGMGGEVDLHAAHWHGQTVLNHGRRIDVIELLRLSMSSVDMLADNQAVPLPCDRSYRGGHEHPVLYSVLDALLK